MVRYSVYNVVILSHKHILILTLIRYYLIKDHNTIGNMEHIDQLCNDSFFIGLCYYCKFPGTTTQPLKRCGGCQLVAYCSRDCQKNNRSSHKYVCKQFPVINGKNVLHTAEGHSWEKHIYGLFQQAARLPLAQENKPIFLNPLVCNTCREATPTRLTTCTCGYVSYCSISCSDIDSLHKGICHQLDVKRQLFCKDIERLSYAMRVEDVLQELPKDCYFGDDNHSFKNLSNVVIHVVVSSSMLQCFDYDQLLIVKYWDSIFRHQFLKLKELKVVFILQGKTSNPPSNLKHSLNHECHLDLQYQVCKTANQNITYSFQHSLYHMFFSSLDYIEPDIVVVFDNSKEMLLSSQDHGDIHSEISYRNMTYSHNTVLILMDTTEDQVMQGLRAVNVARPVQQLVSPRRNTSGLGSNFTCLRRK